MSATPNKQASSAWYILPILLGVIGGIIAWLVNRDDDPVKARKFLVLGIVFLVIEIMVFAIWYVLILAAFMPYMFVIGIQS